MDALEAVDPALAIDLAPVRRSWRLGPALVIALGWILFLVLLAALAPVLPIPSPTDIDFLAKRAPPSAAHWLGTDNLGRDELARLIWGARISLIVGLLAPVIGVVFGGALGLLAGYFRGRFEAVVVGGMDVLLAFPPLVFALAVTAYLGQTVPNIILVLGVLGVPA
ncbi:MAG: ABC transporter permease, partial [Acetobacteraceae bacterium]|nr:ABC transporter permease [Acetobacteraceae bacterium]